MYNRTIFNLLAILLLLGLLSAHATEIPVLQTGQSTLANPFDSSTWRRHHGGQMRFNFAHPAAWMSFIDPNTNSIWYAALTNPVNYPQLVQPQFWMQFANSNNWMAWMDPASYATLLNPATYLGWMQPKSNKHFMDPGMYIQVLNPGAYTALTNPALYMRWASPTAYAASPRGVYGGAATFNWFSPGAWMQAIPSGAVSPSPNGEARTDQR
ncbi:MAG: hypothetical protein GY814_06125 [Gammaproteobacteria bacterium]|nr:hypothetical protein [Gammaproteobacteria bacterium]